MSDSIENLSVEQIAKIKAEAKNFINQGPDPSVVDMERMYDEYKRKKEAAECVTELYQKQSGMDAEEARTLVQTAANTRTASIEKSIAKWLLRLEQQDLEPEAAAIIKYRARYLGAWLEFVKEIRGLFIKEDEE